eukprot:m.240593 g.240593  ORF g.240593 m.240593 type:complete len:321 (+) comp15498_c0_seq1:88-1050(+)
MESQTKRSKMNSESMDFLKGYSLSLFPKPDNIITVSESDTLLHAVQELSKNDILCAPVLSEDGVITGVIDMSSILHTILHPLSTLKGVKTVLEDIVALDTLSQQTIESKPSLYLVEEIRLLSESSNLFDACKLLGTLNYHRVIVVDDSNVIVNMITQSAVIRVLANNTDKFPDIADKNLEELHLNTPSTIVSCPSTCITLAAFEHMETNEVSAIPVLDSSKRILGNLSVRNLRELITNSRCYSTLKRPVTEFLAAIVPDTARDEMYPAISCHPTSQLQDVIAKMAVSRIHRIYLQDKEDNLLRVVSLSDVLAVLVTPNAN